MALLKHRGITRASYDALIAPDPNTEYTVLETDGTFTRYIGSKAIKDKTAARLDNEGNFNIGGKDIKNVKELTVAELTSLVESIVVKKTLELQADINFDGHKAIHPNIENGVLENELDANSQEIIDAVFRNAKRTGDNPTNDDDIVDLKTLKFIPNVLIDITIPLGQPIDSYTVYIDGNNIVNLLQGTGYGKDTFITVMDIKSMVDVIGTNENLVLSNYDKTISFELSTEVLGLDYQTAGRFTFIKYKDKTYIYSKTYNDQTLERPRLIQVLNQQCEYVSAVGSNVQFDLTNCVIRCYEIVGGIL